MRNSNVQTAPQNLNNFDKTAFRATPVHPKERKLTTKELSSVSIFELKKRSGWFEREFAPRKFTLGNTEVYPVKDPIADEWYLELMKPGPRCSSTAISFSESPCNYGGHRDWFECPKCEKRAGILYRKDDNFQCRSCLKLGYFSQRMNYRTLGPRIYRFMKSEKMDARKHRTYKGKPTRYARRYEKLAASVFAGVEMHGPKPTA